MKNCVHKDKDGFCLKYSTYVADVYCKEPENCNGFADGEDTKVLTNADRIRAMSDEELCEMLTIGTGWFDCGDCRDSNECDLECELHCAEWLKQPTKDGEDE